MPMLMTRAGDWHLMWMGQAFIVDTQQSGPRGGDKLYSVNLGNVGRGAPSSAGQFYVALDAQPGPPRSQTAAIACCFKPARRRTAHHSSMHNIRMIS